MALAEIQQAFLGGIPVPAVVGGKGERAAQRRQQIRLVLHRAAVEGGEGDARARQRLPQIRQGRGGDEADGFAHRMRRKLR
jgi:hypothetical protein